MSIKREDKALKDKILHDYKFQTKEVLYLKADNSSTEVHLFNMQRKVVSHNMKTVLEIMGNPNFKSPHRSYSVNLSLEPENKGTHYVLKNGVEIPISRERKDYHLEDEIEDFENFKGFGMW